MTKSFRVCNRNNQDGGEEFPSSDVYSAPQNTATTCNKRETLKGPNIRRKLLNPVKQAWSEAWIT